MAPIPVEAIEELKRSKDLAQVVREHGVELTRKGKNWVGLCPVPTRKTRPPSR